MVKTWIVNMSVEDSSSHGSLRNVFATSSVSSHVIAATTIVLSAYPKPGIAKCRNGLIGVDVPQDAIAVVKRGDGKSVSYQATVVSHVGRGYKEEGVTITTKDVPTTQLHSYYQLTSASTEIKRTIINVQWSLIEL